MIYHLIEYLALCYNEDAIQLNDTKTCISLGRDAPISRYINVFVLLCSCVAASEMVCMFAGTVSF